MAYKRNPMRAERMCSLARLLSSLESPAAQTAATQWLERTLDDSAIRRMIIPQAFLAADAILALYRNVVPGLEVRPAVIARHVDEHIAEMATENILMSAVRAGGDRQELHERVRRHSMAAAERSRASGSVSDLADRIREDPAFRDVAGDGAFDPRRYCGRAPEQVEAFIERVVAPIRARYAELESESVEIDV
jgi:adenylosuccinate lyase